MVECVKGCGKTAADQRRMPGLDDNARLGVEDEDAPNARIDHHHAIRMLAHRHRLDQRVGFIARATVVWAAEKLVARLKRRRIEGADAAIHMVGNIEPPSSVASRVANRIRTPKLVISAPMELSLVRPVASTTMSASSSSGSPCRRRMGHQKADSLARKVSPGGAVQREDGQLARAAFDDNEVFTVGQEARRARHDELAYPRRLIAEAEGARERRRHESRAKRVGFETFYKWLCHLPAVIYSP